MALLLAGLWAAVACTMLQPEATLAGSAMKLPRPFNLCQQNKSGHAAGRIFKGFIAPKRRFGYIAYVVNYDKETYCSGALIHERWVLTAAHCIHNATKVGITLGATNFSSQGEYRQCHIADKILSVPRYRPNHTRHDVGLLHLPKPADLGAFIRTIPVARRSEHDDPVFDGTIAGWGNLGNSSFSNISQYELRYLFVKTVNENVCKRKFGEGFDDISDCMKGVGGSPCVGDDGSPVEYEGKVHGVVSKVDADCGEGLPIIVTNLGDHLHWIKKTLNSTGDQLFSTTTQRTP